MTQDARIRKLSDILAELIVTVIDIANTGAALGDEAPAAAVQVVDEGDKPPAARRGRPPKAESAQDAGKTSADDPATAASEHGTEMAAGSAGTMQSTGPKPSIMAPSEDAEPDTLQTAKELVVKLVQAKGRDAAVELLTRYEAVGDDGKPNAKNLKDGDLAAFCAEAREQAAA